MQASMNFPFHDHEAWPAAEMDPSSGDLHMRSDQSDSQQIVKKIEAKAVETFIRTSNLHVNSNLVKSLRSQSHSMPGLKKP
jgi:hypothetical protein